MASSLETSLVPAPSEAYLSSLPIILQTNLRSNTLLRIQSQMNSKCDSVPNAVRETSSSEHKSLHGTLAQQLVNYPRMLARGRLRLWGVRGAYICHVKNEPTPHPTGWEAKAIRKFVKARNSGVCGSQCQAEDRWISGGQP